MRKVKVLFVIPPYYNYHSYGDKNITRQLPAFTIPYGVLSIAAYVKEHSRHDVVFEVLDLNLQAHRLVRDSSDPASALSGLLRSRVSGFDPELVAISTLFNSCYSHLEPILAVVKSAAPGAMTVTGGGLATNMYRELLETFPLIEAACYGEGEKPFCELVDAPDRGAYLASAAPWITRTSLEAGRAPQLDLLADLDQIPFFDYRLIDLESYSSRSLDKRYASLPKTEMSIHTSRGCPFDCVFCANGRVHGKKVRYMSVEKALSEVRRMVERYRADVLLIEDDHFLSDRGRAKRILSGIAQFGLKVEFPNGIAVYGIDEEIGALLRRAGVTTISLAIESGSDYVLRQVIKKPLAVKMIKPAVEILSRNGIDVHAFIVTGLPGETGAHREETRRMLHDVGFDWVKIYIAIPIVGSRLFDICKENGYLGDESYADHVTTSCVIRTPDIDPVQLESEVYDMNLDINFVNNFNLRSGNFEKAAIYFDSIAKRYPDHAFAHHALAAAYQGLGLGEEAVRRHRERFSELVSSDESWRRYAQRFGLLEAG